MRDGVVPSRWIDSNGHVSMHQYVGLIDSGCEDFFGAIYPNASNELDQKRFVVSRLLVNYKREMFLADSWALTSCLIAIHEFTGCLRFEIRRGREVSVIAHVQFVLINSNSRKITEIPNKVREILGTQLVTNGINPFEQEYEK